MKNYYILFVLSMVFTMFLVPVSAEVTGDPVADLGLKEYTLEGGMLYYEPCLEGAVEQFEQKYNKCLGLVKDVNLFDSSGVKANKDKIVESIYSIVGLEDEKSVVPKTIDAFCLKVQPVQVLAESDNMIYLILQSTTKEYLKDGGSLPNASYDSETDKAEVSNLLFTMSGVDFEVVMPVPSEEEAGKLFDIYFGMMDYDFDDSLNYSSIMIHEAAEVAILYRLRTDDPYKRWFSDGFANAIAYELTAKYFSQESADSFLEAYQISKYEDLRNKVNLRYWMSADYLNTNDWPIELEKRLVYARYCFATELARKIIAENGIECVKKILDIYESNLVRTGEGLLTAVEQATGFDIENALVQYQEYPTRRELQRAYVQKMNEGGITDINEIYCIMLRLLELSDSPFDRNSSTIRANLAANLYKNGHKETAVELVSDFVKRLNKTNIPVLTKMGRLVFVEFALNVNEPEIGLEYAEEILVDNPDDTFALTLIMLHAAKENDNDRAREIAVKLCELVPDENNPAYKSAKKVLDSLSNIDVQSAGG